MLEQVTVFSLALVLFNAALLAMTKLPNDTVAVFPETVVVQLNPYEVDVPPPVKAPEQLIVRFPQVLAPETPTPRAPEPPVMLAHVIERSHAPENERPDPVEPPVIARLLPVTTTAFVAALMTKTVVVAVAAIAALIVSVRVPGDDDTVNDPPAAADPWAAFLSEFTVIS